MEARRKANNLKTDEGKRLYLRLNIQLRKENMQTTTRMEIENREGKVITNEIKVIKRWQEYKEELY